VKGVEKQKRNERETARVKSCTVMEYTYFPNAFAVLHISFLDLDVHLSQIQMFCWKPDE
jgi:hypothetical protein